MPFFRVLPNRIVHVLQLRDWRIALELSLIGIVPRTNRRASGRGAVFEVVANGLTKRQGVEVVRAVGSNPVNAVISSIFGSDIY